MTAVHTLPDGRVRIICKGAPEAMLTPAVLATDPDVVARAARRSEELAADGYRMTGEQLRPRR